jgi:hypothetical protein
VFGKRINMPIVKVFSAGLYDVPSLPDELSKIILALGGADTC